MLTFPQLSTGVSLQYPIRKQNRRRTVRNISEDGRLIAWSDPFSQLTRWNLSFSHLSDQEKDTLLSFYAVCEGCLQPFLFIDPTENLMAYSEDLSQTSWQISSLVGVDKAVADPHGTALASRLTNRAAATLALSQSIPVPGFVACAFSVYLRADNACDCQIVRTDGSTTSSRTIQVSTTWGRFSLTSQFASSVSTSCSFSVAIQPNTSIDVFGLQVDAQTAPGTYVASGDPAGIYEAARFDCSSVSVVATGPNQNAVSLSIVSGKNR